MRNLVAIIEENHRWKTVQQQRMKTQQENSMQALKDINLDMPFIMRKDWSYIPAKQMFYSDVNSDLQQYLLCPQTSLTREYIPEEQTKSFFSKHKKEVEL